MGLVVWKITGEGNLAILFSILADGFAAIPTVIKSYFQPETESSRAYLFGAINAAIALLTIRVWSFAQWAFPVYIFGICVLIYVLVRFRLGLVIQKKFGK